MDILENIDLVLYGIILLLYVIIVVITFITIIVAKQDPIKSLMWIIIISILPIFGLVGYWSFGRNLRKKRIIKRSSLKVNQYFSKLVNKQKYEITIPSTKSTRSMLENRKMVNLLFNNNDAPISYNNEATILNDGENTFENIKRELLKAKVFIHLEYYIIESDNIGKEIADILIQKASEGVEVRLIFDDVGSWTLKKSYIKRLVDNGVKVHAYLPVNIPLFASRINYRNHRKIIVIDGLVGFTGGINIADRYIHGNNKVGKWRDTHLMLNGASVIGLQAIFANDWFFVCGKMLDDSKYTPMTKVTNQCAIQIASSGPDSEWASIMQAFFSAITKAKRHIYISTPYFIPSTPIVTAIKVAAMSGIDVRIMIPKIPDNKMVYYATCSYIGELLAANVKIYFYSNGFNHSKILMTDSIFSSVGTANMDVRSFEQNFEVSAMIYDNTITKELENTFLKDLKDSERVYLKDWIKRPRLNHFIEGITRLFTPLL